MLKALVDISSFEQSKAVPFFISLGILDSLTVGMTIHLFDAQCTIMSSFAVHSLCKVAWTNLWRDGFLRYSLGDVLVEAVR